MKSLHVTETLVGGVGTYVNALLADLSDEFGSGSVLLIAPDRGSDQLTDVDGSRVRLFRQSGRDASSLWRFARAIQAAIRDHRPDVIHLHGTFAGLIGRPLAAVASPAPRVYCPHGWAFDMEQSPIKAAAIRSIERLLAPLSSQTVAISEHELRQARGLGVCPSRLRLILNGVPDHFGYITPAHWTDGRLRILFVGRPDRQKGLDLLMAAAPNLSDVADFRVAGANPGQLAALGAIPSNVMALGWLTAAEVASQIAGADAVVVPSRWEGFGLVAIEAMRAGRCAIVADVGGLGERVEDGVTGRKLPAPVTPEDITRVVRSLNRRAVRAMGQAARVKFAEAYEFTRVRREVLALYRDILTTGPDGSSER